VRLLARLGAALIEARENGADLQEAVASAIRWDKLARSVTEAEPLARPDKTDLPDLAARAWPVLHRLGPPCRPPPRPCARSSFCAQFTGTAARNGRLVLQLEFILKFPHRKDKKLLGENPDIPSEVDGTRWISEVEKLWLR
jgi:hypothetical protein